MQLSSNVSIFPCLTVCQIRMHGVLISSILHKNRNTSCMEKSDIDTLVHSADLSISWLNFRNQTVINTRLACRHFFERPRLLQLNTSRDLLKGGNKTPETQSTLCNIVVKSKSAKHIYVYASCSVWSLDEFMRNQDWRCSTVTSCGTILGIAIAIGDLLTVNSRNSTGILGVPGSGVGGLNDCMTC